MIQIPRAKLDEAHAILSASGFEKQHARISHYAQQVGSEQYLCVIGFENGAEDTFELHLSILKGPATAGKASVRDMKVVAFEATPESFQKRIEDVEEKLIHM